MFCKIKPVVKNINDKKTETILFAAWELQKYLGYVLDSGDFPVITANTYKEVDEHTIYIGIDLTEKLAKADDPFLDDNIYIEVENFNGVITGTNPRSVLIGVYRFLREKGYAFLHPGKHGEVIPNSINGDKVLVSEQATCRYRTMSIEGSVFQENLMDLIDWMPKVSMNGYFVQFTIPYVFFDRYYGDTNSDITFLGNHRDSHPLTNEEVISMIELLEVEIEKRDLQYHSIGHGWTSKAFGIESTSWEPQDIELTEDQISMMAMLNGKRGLREGMPMSTQICMSNPVARGRMTDGIIDHLRTHRNVTHLHFWLADGRDNYCECEECEKLRLSDWYVMALNELDEKLSAEGMDTKIVAAVGGGLYWKPLKEKIKNPDRFVFRLAPITRRFSQPLCRDENVKMKEYKGNKSEYPKYGSEVIAYYDDWCKDYDIDCLDFDYHYIWEHYFDFTQRNINNVLYQDLVNYKELNIDGIISCQVQRASIPDCVGMQILARTLWNREEKLEDIENETLLAEYGEDYKKIKDYLYRLAEHNCIDIIRCETAITPEAIDRECNKALEIIDSFESEIITGIENASCQRQKFEWEKLRFHNRLYRRMIEYYKNYYNPDKEKYENEVYDFAKSGEQKFKDVFDAYYFCWTFELLIKPRLSRVEVIK